MGYVLNVKLDFIWIKLENVFNFRQTAQKLTQQEHALNVFKDLYWLKAVFVLNKLLTVPNTVHKELANHAIQAFILMPKVHALFFQPTVFQQIKLELALLVRLVTLLILKEHVNLCLKIVTWLTLTVFVHNATWASILINKRFAKLYLIIVLKLIQMENVLNVKMILSFLMVNVSLRLDLTPTAPNKILSENVLNVENSMNSKTVTVFLLDKTLSVDQDHVNVEQENVSNVKKDTSLMLMVSVLQFLKTVKSTARVMEHVQHVKRTSLWATDNVFLLKNQYSLSIWTVKLRPIMELVQNAENITNLLTDNALHLTKIQNVRFIVKKMFVNAVTIQTSTTLITTTFVQRKKPTVLK